MYPRIMVTGIPSSLSNAIVGAKGTDVYYTESLPDWQRKDDFLRFMRNISNTGNFLIGDGAMQALPRDATTHIPFWHLAGKNLDDPDFFRGLKSRFDVCVFTAANLIRSDLSAALEAQVLERIDLPLVVLGIGIQRFSDLKSGLPEGTQKFLRILKERDAHVFTRGHETAAFLRELGLSKVRPSGCPSMYVMPDRVVQAWRDFGKFVPAKTTRYVFSGYLGNEDPAGVIHDMNGLLDSNNSCRYVLQDEPVTYGMEFSADPKEIIYDSVTGRLTCAVLFPNKELIKPHIEVHSFFDAAQWRTWTAMAADFSLQRRFHGHMVALQAGIPSIAIALDDRMREMLSFIGFPYLESAEWAQQGDKQDYLMNLIRKTPTDTVIDCYLQRRDAFKNNLHDAGLASSGQNR
jgi:Polysaccharide pyruvyl transferase